MSREEINSVLTAERDSGVFLVRDSMSIKGDFVLSVKWALSLYCYLNAVDPTLMLTISLPNINWFSKFFHWQILQTIHYKPIIKCPTCTLTTLLRYLAKYKLVNMWQRYRQWQSYFSETQRWLSITYFFGQHSGVLCSVKKKFCKTLWYICIYKQRLHEFIYTFTPYYASWLLLAQFCIVKSAHNLLRICRNDTRNRQKCWSVFRRGTFLDLNFLDFLVT